MNSTRKPTLLIVDAMCVIRRIYEGVPVAEPVGKAQGAMKAAASSIMKTLKVLEPTHFLLAMDTHGRNWRHDIFEDYKAHRAPTPPALVEAIPSLLEQLDSYGLKSVSKSGFEADDIINTVALKAVVSGMRVIVDSTDKDFLKLLSNGVEIWDHFGRTWRDEQYCRNKFGVASEQITDYLALAGDEDDGIPGIAGVGPKTASALLGEFSSLDGVIENAHALTGKMGDKVRAGIESARLSFQLATMSDKVPLEINASDLRIPARMPSPADAYNGLRMNRPLPQGAPTPATPRQDSHLARTPAPAMHESEIDDSIELILYRDRGTLYVSHGIDNLTGKTVILPTEPLKVFESMGARFNADSGSWLLPKQTPHDSRNVATLGRHDQSQARASLARPTISGQRPSRPTQESCAAGQAPVAQPVRDPINSPPSPLRRMRSTRP